VILLAPLVAGLIELALVLLVALFLRDRYDRERTPQPPDSA
jgi:hypothetical protein